MEQRTNFVGLGYTALLKASNAAAALFMTTTLFLARHGAHADLGRTLTGRRGGAPLSEVGRADARRLARRLANEQVSIVQTSPRERARETAAIVAEHVGASLEVAPALDEIDFGDWTGRSFAELAGDPAWSSWNERRSDASIPGGEAMTAAVARAVAHLEQLAEAAHGRVLCVSHCDIIRGVIAHYLGLPLDNLLRFDIDAGSLSAIVLEDWGARVTMLNDRCAA